MPKEEMLKQFDLNNWNLPEDEMHKKMESLALQMRSALIRQEKTEGQRKKTFDTYAIDVFFCRDFIDYSYDLKRDFQEVMHHFLRQEGSHIFSYAEKNRLPYFGMEEDPLNDLIYQRVLYLILTGAREGSEYSRELLRSLYKTYYKREYNGLKRFKKMNEMDVIGFVREDDMPEDEMIATVSRVMTIAPFFDIEFDFIVPAIQASFENLLHNREQRIHSMQQLNQCSHTEVDEKLEDVKNLMELNEKSKKHWSESEIAVYEEVMDFIEQALLEIGYDPDVFHQQNEDYFGELLDMANAKAIIDRFMPDVDVTYEKIQVFGAIYYALSTFVCLHDEVNRSVDVLLGFTNGDSSGMFKPPVLRENKKGPEKRTNTPENGKPVNSKTDSGEEFKFLKQELEDTLKKLHRLESAYGSLIKEKQELEKRLKDSLLRMEQAENEHAELVALRNHLYRITEEDNTSHNTSKSIEEMKEELKSRKILIIGGHPNWINKLRREFPGWLYSGANLVQSEDASKVVSADYVYFFTDTLSHGAYWKFLTVLRNRKIPFGYLHSVNLENNIRQIYEDTERG
ncbi:MAG: hypothetical protein IJD29_04150 [Anaerotignum sp.]|nr:hypothetical protein [Anaerotignum sp.]